MPKFISALLLGICCYSSALAQDSLFITEKNDKWVIPHRVRQGEDIFLLASRYHVPPALMSDVNKVDYQKPPERGSVVYIPLGSFNQLSDKATSPQARKLFYQVAADDNLYRISKNAGVNQKQVQEWNNLSDGEIKSGQTLLVGYVKYGAAPKPPVSATPAPAAAVKKDDKKLAKKDSLKKGTFVLADSVSVIERLYLTQTNNEQKITEEKGSVVFFDNTGKVNNSKMIFAFHNTAKKGTVIKVYNPGSGKTAFVKVLGPIPGTKQYHNSVLGIGSGAKALLGVNESKAWCELKYAN